MDALLFFQEEITSSSTTAFPGAVPETAYTYQETGLFSIVPDLDGLQKPVYYMGKLLEVVGHILEHPFCKIGTIFLKNLSPLASFREQNRVWDAAEILGKISLTVPLFAVTIAAAIPAFIGNFSLALGVWLARSSRESSTLDRIEYDSRYFPKEIQVKELTYLKNKEGEKNPFKVGVGCSHYQQSFDENFAGNSDWGEANRKFIKEGKFDAGQACGGGFDPVMFSDLAIEKLKILGVRTFRFSVEWAHVAELDEKGSPVYEADGKTPVFREEALEDYKNLLIKLKEAGIDPCITLHHFVTPKGISNFKTEESKAGEKTVEPSDFEKEETIEHMVAYAKKAYDSLKEAAGDKAEWITINEPGIIAFQGWGLGEWPPFKTGHLGGALRVFRNLIDYHNQVYAYIKEQSPNATAGMVHQSLLFIPYRTWNPIERLVGHFMSLVTDTFFKEYLRTGVLDMYFPLFGRVRYDKPFRSGTLYVNVYVRPLIPMAPSEHWNTREPGSPAYSYEDLTNMPFREDPAASTAALRRLSRAVKEGAFPNNVQNIAISENGLASEKQEQIERFYSRVFYCLNEYVKETGTDAALLPLVELLCWALSDNFEWGEGYGEKDGSHKMPFGVFAYDKREAMEKINSLEDKTLERIAAIIEEQLIEGASAQLLRELALYVKHSAVV